MDSGKCGQGDDVNLGMCGPGNAWTQGHVGMGTLGLGDDADFGACGVEGMDLRTMWTLGCVGQGMCGIGEYLWTRRCVDSVVARKSLSAASA